MSNEDAPDVWVWGYGQICSVCDRPTDEEPCPYHQPGAHQKAES